MLTVLAAALLSVVVQARSFKIGDTVKTTSGAVAGQPSSWKPEVAEYLGIRYAQPPVGDLRWANPIAINASGQAVSAIKYVSSCQRHMQVSKDIF
jgi:carboxylesterase type B